MALMLVAMASAARRAPLGPGHHARTFHVAARETGTVATALVTRLSVCGLCPA